MKKFLFTIGIFTAATHIQAQNFVPFHVTEPIFSKNNVNIAAKGAVGNGQYLNTSILQDAIDSISKLGGGTIIIPEGIWLTGPIELQNNIRLQLNQNALLLFTHDFSQYKIVKDMYEGMPEWRNQPLIWGKNLSNIAITGNGVIDGNGNYWRMMKKDKMLPTDWNNLVQTGILSSDGNTWYPTISAEKGSHTQNAGDALHGETAKTYEDIKDYLRPKLITLNHCSNILIEGVTIQNSPAWTIHPYNCSDVTLRDIHVKNNWNAQNTDGIDVEACKNVQILHSIFEDGDDGICIKSGKKVTDWSPNIPTENVIIANCTVYRAHGGIVIGSEMSGGVKNLRATNNTFMGTDIGLRFKTTRGRGGIVQNIFVDNCNMLNIRYDAVLFDMYYTAISPSDKEKAPKIESVKVDASTPQFKHFRINNIRVKGARRALFVRGLPEMPIQDIQLSNMTIEAQNGMECTEAKNIHLDNCQFITPTNKPVIQLNNSQNLTFKKVILPNDTKIGYQITGAKSTGITIDGLKNKDPIQINNEVSKNAVILY
ncbi:glycoside hydrolase family 28 protein [Rhizosphaericola mali]|uniref:Glycoside hydrolase family 28 protein n=1 Tax=Rhizosphaericola mali TaxID=2545455 RepID=A0A5P2GGC2_9BACT|nr:glycoside hydrolase family 28 protein [Rhizosphaericola mali]QES90791.1 glycoside hydrolase family 28 protein [Rhizosphaericola mali]